jgi:hypothetical protein
MAIMIVQTMANQTYVIVRHSQGGDMSVASTHADKESAVAAFRTLVESEYEWKSLSYEQVEAMNDAEGLDYATMVNDSSFVYYEDGVYGFGIVAVDPSNE